jgi:hypothetical protein
MKYGMFFLAFEEKFRSAACHELFANNFSNCVLKPVCGQKQNIATVRSKDLRSKRVFVVTTDSRKVENKNKNNDKSSPGSTTNSLFLSFF